MKIARTKALMQGKVWHRPGYGYEWDEEKNWVVKESEAEVVCEIFRLAEEGKRIREIAKRIRKLTAPTDVSKSSKASTSGSKSPWSSKRVRDILQSEIYVGDYLSNKTCHVIEKDGRKRTAPNKGIVDQILIRDHHPAIVSRELFEKVSNLIKNMEEANSVKG